MGGHGEGEDSKVKLVDFGCGAHIWSTSTCGAWLFFKKKDASHFCINERLPPPPPRFAKIIGGGPSSALTTACGTPEYVAPEVLKADRTHRYGTACDVTTTRPAASKVI